MCGKVRNRGHICLEPGRHVGERLVRGHVRRYLETLDKRALALVIHVWKKAQRVCRAALEQICRGFCVDWFSSRVDSGKARGVDQVQGFVGVAVVRACVWVVKVVGGAERVHLGLEESWAQLM